MVVPRRHRKQKASVEALNTEPQETLSELEISSAMNDISLALRTTGIRHFSLQWHSSLPSIGPYEQRLLLNDTTIDVLSAIQERLSQLLDAQFQARQAVKIQANVRGWLVRKNTQEMFRVIPQVRVGKQIFIELLTTEDNYIRMLKEAIRLHLIPLRAKATGDSEDIQDIIAIFSNIETLVDVHEKIYQGMLELQDESWPMIQGLGRLFMKYAPTFQNYQVYAENYKTSEATLDKVLSQRKSKLREVIEQGEGGSERLKRILKMPLQHIEKYQNIFGAFVSIPKGLLAEEFEILSRVHAIVQNINELVARNRQQAVRFAIIQEVQRSIISDRPINLLQENRFLVRKGSLNSSAQKKLTYFLFNDVMLLTKSQNEKFRLLHFINLADAALKEIPDKSKKDTYELSFGDTAIELREDKKDIIGSLPIIEGQIVKLKKTNIVFSVHLLDLLSREQKIPGRQAPDGVPRVVSFLVDHLRKNGIRTEGILRHAGNQKRIETLQKLLDNAQISSYNDIDMSPYDVHDVGAVLRVFFRDLPEPVIPFRLYEPLMEIQRDASLTLDERIGGIQTILDQMPKPHIPLLRYLIAFLQDIEEHSDANKMTVSNLAIVFGPNLIKPKIETVQNALEMPLLQGIVQILIEHDDRTNLTLLKQNQEKDGRPVPSGMLSFRSLSRSSPGCELPRTRRVTSMDSDSESESSQEASSHSEQEATSRLLAQAINLANPSEKGSQLMRSASGTEFSPQRSDEKSAFSKALSEDIIERRVGASPKTRKRHAVQRKKKAPLSPLQKINS